MSLFNPAVCAKVMDRGGRAVLRFGVSACDLIKVFLFLDEMRASV